VKVPFSGLWAEFKSFAFKGNMIELAVAVVIGAAFGKVVTAMVDDVVMPTISYAVIAVTTVKDTATESAKLVAEKTGIATTQPATQPTAIPVDQATAAATPAAATTPPPPPPPPATPVAPPKDPTKVVEFSWHAGLYPIGDLIGALLNFIIVAFAVFIMIVKLVGTVQKRFANTPGPSEPTTKECPFCLSLIPIKARKCAHCTADMPVNA
jgi:large conductance mechanosensitive channel